MEFSETDFSGVFVIDIFRHEDERGFFGRSWCQNEFEEHHLNSKLVQCNVSYNTCQGTLRGMHFQEAPYAEVKLVRCTMGAIFDVIIDLRRESKTYKHWFSIELTAQNRRGLYIPEGFAHGFQTMVDNTEVFYQMSQFYHPEASRGIRWNDPVFCIAWPEGEKIISEKDMNYPFWDDK
jgi:dTDP-4-dehydrorhamnose 3,5-epimerase